MEALPADPVLGEQEFRALVRQSASGVAIITVAWGGIFHGMTASSFTTVSFSPPLILVCLHRLCRTHRFIQEASHFAINLLSEEQRQWSERFAGRHPVTEDRFEGIPLLTAMTGAPILADCLAWLDCCLMAAYPGGDHTIFVGEVVAGNKVRGGKPLIYYQGGYHFINK